jgi:LmbE family N-acetylglucosaminyl deacetylase
MPSRRILLPFVVLFGLSASGGVGAVRAQDGAPIAVAEGGYEGAAATGLALRRLGTTARVLHIGAHPDDENTALFAPLALGQGVDAAYLSLTRGEGGQNGIGPELGIALGVIRSEELLAARRLDGGDQFFTRAIDYGYSKDADEAFRHWPRDSLLADVVSVIRRYRPDVIASVWSGTPRDGHGQHQAAGIIAREATLAAGDPDRFPEQIEAGLRPHSPALYYRSSWFSRDAPDVELNTGSLDPLLGASYHQVAMASRSRHRSQDQGRSLDPGPRSTGFEAVDPAAEVTVSDARRPGRYGTGAADGTASMFQGVDTLLSQRAFRLPGAGAAGEGGVPALAAALVRYEDHVAAARDHYDALAPWALLPELARAAELLDRTEAELAGAGEPADPAAADLLFHVRAERADLRRAMLHAANVRVDVVADRAAVVPGQSFELELSAWNGGTEPARVRPRPALPDGWRAQPEDAGPVLVAPGEREAVTYRVTVPVDAPPTTPYYLDPRAPEPVDLYRWPDSGELHGLPYGPPPVRGAFSIALADAAPFDVVRDAARIGVDRRAGEYREPVKVVPAVSVALDPAVAVVPLSTPDRPLEFTVRLRGQAPDAIDGRLRPVVPAGWTAAPAAVPVRLEPGTERSVTFQVTAPAAVEAGAYDVGATFEAGDASYALGYRVVDYPHIAPHHLYRPARAAVRVLDVRVADVRVGYIAGAGDGIPEALDQLGVPWEALDADALADGDLHRFDVIVTGTRAYEVRDDIVAHNQRLLDWARDGGTLIVQYNKYPALERDYAPWPVTIARPHGRVTDEGAPVTLLEPDHPAFTTPNPIGDADWDGWVQERGLYFWETWDGPLTPLLAMSDPGEEPLTGSLLVAPLGEGTYVYTALAFFRQLPEGVPGAYRLLANLLSLGAQ